MADNLSTPRITSQYLDAFTNKTVRIIGKVTQLRGETASIDSEGVVTAHLNRVLIPLHPLSPGSPEDEGWREQYGGRMVRGTYTDVDVGIGFAPHGRQRD
jgi:hypothetical protein